MVKLKHIALLREVAGVYGRYGLAQPLFPKPFLPLAMHLIATHRCNARCVMCGIWREGDRAGEELSLADLEGILADKLFSRLEYVGISGGEPFLRSDLPDLVGLFHRKCPRLKRISITTNGLLPEIIGPATAKIARLSGDNGVLLDVSVSMHGLGEVLARIYGVEDAYARIRRSLEILKTHRGEGTLTVSLNCVLLKDNLGEARSLTAWAESQNLPVSFVVGEQRERFFNREMEGVFIGAEKRRDLIAFFREMGSSFSLNNPSAMRYGELAAMLEGGRERTLSCYYALGGFVLGHDGGIFYCSHSRAVGNCRRRPAAEIFYDRDNLRYRREEILGRECRRCPPYTRMRWELERDVFKALGMLMKRSLFGRAGHE